MTSPLPPNDSSALALCSQEPIHIPGAIQPHGALLVLDEGSLKILQASANWNALTGTGAGAGAGSSAVSVAASVESPVGKTLPEVLGPEAAARVNDMLNGREPAETADQLLSLRLLAGMFDTVLHRHDGVIIAELEPATGPPAVPMNRVLQQAMRDLRSAPSMADFYQATAAAVSRLTGYGRVMMYRFDRDWHGQVVGEHLSLPGMESWMNHHFPASDIPEQARALYTKSWLRIIPEVNYTPSPVLPPANPVTGRPLDLSFSVLRSVSPVHLQYLRNMGVNASMSISLIIGGRLWGLIACHHPEPRRLPFHARSSCEIFGQVASLEIAFREEKQRLDEAAEATRIQTRFFDIIASEPNFAEALVKYTPDLLAFMKADGAALHLNGATTLLGTTPEPSQVPALLDWLKSQEMAPVFSTDSLGKLFAPADDYRPQASGLLAVRLSPVEFQCIVFFRPEVLKEITWAGNPVKPADPGQALTPRQSFAAWVETVRGQSLPWSEVDRQGGVELRMALNALVLKRTERLISSNLELEKRNTDLQSFAYIASHDLKEPLRGIARYSEYIEEDHGAALDIEALRKLRTIHHLATHSGRLIDALNRFSHVGRMEINRRLVDTDALVDGVIAGLGDFLKSRNVEIRRQRPLPSCLCDSVLAREVFSNLIVNAAKYQTETAPWIEISSHEDSLNPGVPIYSVADNGIGIAEKHWDAIFIMFRRLHPKDAYGGGTGAGLAIARSIVVRHGGWISVNSRPGEGSVFSFTFG